MRASGLCRCGAWASISFDMNDLAQRLAAHIEALDA